MRATLAVVFATCSGLASADEISDIGKLLKGGQLDQASQRVDAYLASKPRDAQGQFLKGLIQTEQNKTAEAIATFTRLTELYPELPEPYNNLAVLYAGQGQYEKARTALEMAIRTHPSYATAHENLGDVYAKLASQAYDKALQLDSNNPTAQTKLALVRDLIGARPRTQVAQAARQARGAAGARPRRVRTRADGAAKPFRVPAPRAPRADLRLRPLKAPVAAAGPGRRAWRESGACSALSAARRPGQFRGVLLPPAPALFLPKSQRSSTRSACIA